jgi:hypothetical protein
MVYNQTPNERNQQMNRWRIRQLQSWLDAHEINYGWCPKQLHDRHYQKYLVGMVQRARTKPIASSIAEENKSASMIDVCSVCMSAYCSCEGMK